MLDNQIYIKDDTGKEVLMNILLTVNIDDINYVLVYQEDNIDEVYPFSYDEDNNLLPVEDEETLNLLSEVLQSYDSQEEN